MRYLVGTYSEEQKERYTANSKEKIWYSYVLHVLKYLAQIVDNTVRFELQS